MILNIIVFGFVPLVRHWKTVQFGLSKRKKKNPSCNRFRVSCLFSPLQTGERSGQVEKSKKNARQRQNDFKVRLDETRPSPPVFENQRHLTITRWRPVCFVENDRGDDPSPGEAHSRGPSPHHPAAGRTESLRGLGCQDGADRSLADPDHTHCQVLGICSHLRLIDYAPFSHGCIQP